MKTLKDILYRVPIVEIVGHTDGSIVDFHFDSRQIQENWLFIAVKGTQTDGHAHIDSAIQSGASAIVCEQLPATLVSGISYIRVKDSGYSLGEIAANYYDNPSKKLSLVGITGTNGKTSIATWLHDVFSLMGYFSGLISTIEIRLGTANQNARSNTHTTPDPKQLNAILSSMVTAGCQYCFMEVSSHSIDQKRIAGLHYAGGVFTNLTHDHLDYHLTFKNYLLAKKSFFDDLPFTAFALINIDDKNGKVMVQETKARIKTYSIMKGADYHTKIAEATLEGMCLTLGKVDTWVRVHGDFNAYNILAVYAVCIELGMVPDEVLLALSQLSAVRGRFETVALAGCATGIVDYAHTPDALRNILKSIRHLQLQSGKLITLIGCGGNRDQEKRPLMAKIAAEYSDLVILTSDNPRDENPLSIIEDMEAGIPFSARHKLMVISNRGEAIAAAVRLAETQDTILVAGKGHETYQDISGERLHFDDKEELMNAFNYQKN